MMNGKTYQSESPSLKKLIVLKRQMIKDFLEKLSPEAHLMFKRMYSHKDLEKHINQVVDDMPEDKLDWALIQCERTKPQNH